jgi:hypothetical protein
MTDKQISEFSRVKYHVRMTYKSADELLTDIRMMSHELYVSDGVTPRNLSPEGYRQRHRWLLAKIERYVELMHPDNEADEFNADESNHVTE